MSLQLNQDHLDLLHKIRLAYPTGKIYLVGGAVRDLLLEKEVKDFDFVVADASVELANAVRRKLGAVGFTLDDERQTARVILKKGRQTELLLDFTSFIGNSLEEDLSQRDFTLNAMAIDLDQPDQLIDPLDGLTDLKQRQIRLSNPNSLQSDPLRVLRAVRMIRTYNLKHSPEFLHALRVATMDLNRVSGERIRDELLKCLDLPGLDQTVALLQSSGILAQLNQRIFGFSTEIDQESYLSLLRDLEKLLGLIEKEKSLSLSENSSPSVNRLTTDHVLGLEAIFSENIQGGRSRKQLLVLFSLFFMPNLVALENHQIPGLNVENFAELNPEDVSERFMKAFLLGQKERKYLEDLSGGYFALKSLTEKEELERLDYYRYFRDFGSYGLDSALLYLFLSASDASVNQKFDAFATKIIWTWFANYEEIVDPPHLIDGDQLQKALHLEPGPKIGVLLEMIREAQVLKYVEDFNQAIEFAQKTLEEMEEL